MSKNIYVLDTSACLTDGNVLTSFGNNDVVLPLKVLDEIDGHKKRQDGVGANARFIIRTLDSLREKGNLNKGVKIDDSRGTLSVKNYDPSVIKTTKLYQTQMPYMLVLLITWLMTSLLIISMPATMYT